MSLQITPELASIVLAFGLDRLAFRLFLKERLTEKRFLSAVGSGLISLIAPSFISPYIASWTPDMMLWLGVSCVIAACIKTKYLPTK